MIPGKLPPQYSLDVVIGVDTIQAEIAGVPDEHLGALFKEMEKELLKRRAEQKKRAETKLAPSPGFEDLLSKEDDEIESFSESSDSDDRTPPRYNNPPPKQVLVFKVKESEPKSEIKKAPTIIADSTRKGQKRKAPSNEFCPPTQEIENDGFDPQPDPQPVVKQKAPSFNFSPTLSIRRLSTGAQASLHHGQQSQSSGKIVVPATQPDEQGSAAKRPRLSRT